MYLKSGFDDEVGIFGRIFPLEESDFIVVDIMVSYFGLRLDHSTFE